MPTDRPCFIINLSPNNHQHMRHLILSLSVVSALFLTAVCLSSCGGEKDSGREVHPDPVGEQADYPDSMLYLGASQARLAGVRWEKLRQDQSPMGQTLFGEWVLHPEHRYIVSVPAAGRVRQLHYQLNDEVKAGALLVELESHAFLQLQQQYLEAASQLSFLKADLERTTRMQAEQATSQKAYEQAQSAYQAAASLEASLSARLALYGVTPGKLKAEGIQPTYVLRAAKKGRVVLSLVSPGQWLEEGAPICTLADFEFLHADLFVYPHQHDYFRPGDAIRLQLQGGTGEIMGKVLHLDQVIDPMKQAARMHVLPEKRGSVAIPTEGSFVQAYVAISGVSGSYYVPLSGMRKELDGDFILVHEPSASPTEELAFRKVYVRIVQDHPEGIWFVPLSPLSGDEMVVMEGAYYIDAHSRIGEFGEED